MKRMRWMMAAVVAAGLGMALHLTLARAANPNALWDIVHDKCVPDLSANGSPKPCDEVDLAEGVALLKDIVGDTQFLLIPTARVSGIEDAQILAPDAPNYFADAWARRGAIDARAHRLLPRDAVSLAINSFYGRTQNQLHIHMDCLLPEVRAALQQHGAEVPTHWAAFPTELAGHSYQAMRLEGAELAQNPFKLLADGVPGAKEDMGRHTLVLVGARIGGAPGFILLDDRADVAKLDNGSGETLQDHGCALLKDLPTPATAG
jgi:CDP-diacylglycerol pyrophosphatase